MAAWVTGGQEQMEHVVPWLPTNTNLGLTSAIPILISDNMCSNPPSWLLHPNDRLPSPVPKMTENWGAPQQSMKVFCQLHAKSKVPQSALLPVAGSLHAAPKSIKRPQKI